MPQAITVGDIVNVTLSGQRARVLSNYEVLNLPSVGNDYWEFVSPTGEVIAVTGPTAVVKVS